MSLGKFLNALLDHGHAPVETEEPLREDSDAMEVLLTLDRVQRLNLAFDPPPFAAGAALWAARLLYRAAQFLVLRKFGAARIEKDLSAPCPEPRSPSVDYSADLSFQYLPGLIDLARKASADDPLLRSLTRLARAWPLSSVGVEGLGPLAIDSFAGQPALLLLYADRIIAANALPRLGDPRVDLAIREVLGAHPQLSPWIAEALSWPPEGAP